ncbi:hypothetical protein PAXINDRAFT_164509 [Paxillus involutus ATCC 200175]|uniref:Oligopeptide transporter n=1 Tax=Paxillus involutus ATCC 200175 TaxID=664439 RepID=A0A0C9TLJ9_PAXIN|nr:hypothetical protein PAXINDRAFT_164509 [Paxillus involutus ATCC 200175]
MKEKYFSSSSENEKTGVDVDIASIEQQDDNIPISRTINTDDPFPIDPDAPVEERQFTLRAVIVGCGLGAVIAASNVYLGLKTGRTFGASLFGSIFGFAILKPLSTAAPQYFGGGYFGLKENNVVQVAASAAGSLGLLFTSGFPAAYQLGLLNSTPREDIGRLFTFTICCAFFGLAFSIPLRKFYILKLKLVFPSGVAAAYTIQSLHVGKNAAVDAKKKTNALIFSFCFAITLRVVSEYAPGVLWDWHIFYTLSRIGWTSAIRAESWGWVWEWTPAFIGAGMLTGVNASYSFLGGSFLAWAIIGPLIVSAGKVPFRPINHPSPRYWLVWPGTLMLLCASFAEVACNWKSIYMWSSVLRLISSVIITCVIMGVQSGQNVGIMLLVSIFAFLFSFIGCESAGRTNINPVTAIGNASQLVFGGVGKGQHYSVKRGELLNSLSGCLPADMIGDLKTSHLLRSSPKAIFCGQLCGAIVSIFMAAGVYVVFSTAYPCINNLSYTTCSFQTPDVQSWRVCGRYCNCDSLPGYISTYPLATFFGSTIAFFWRRMFFNNYQMYCFAVAAGFIAGILTIAGVSGARYGTSIGCPGGVYCG